MNDMEEFQRLVPRRDPIDKVEVERKFLLIDGLRLPAEGPDQVGFLQQGYLPDGLRLRRTAGGCSLTLKRSGDISRQEWEVNVPKWVFDQLWTSTAGASLTKTRYACRDGEGWCEVDVFHDSLTGLVLMEREFNDGEDVEGYRPPAWCGRYVDVSHDKRFSNASLARAISVPEPTSDPEVLF